MRPFLLSASLAVCLVALTSSSVVAQQSTPSSSPKKKIVYGSLADPANTSRKRSSGAARLEANKSVADKTVRDKTGRITKIFEPDASGKLSIETEFEYNDSGKLKEIKQLGAPGEPVRSRTFGYDADGLLTSQTSPEQGKTLLTLDKSNFIHSTTDARGVSKNFVYDSQHRLVKKTYSDGSPTLQFSYRTRKQPMFVSIVGDRTGPDLQKIERYNKAGALDGTLQKYSDGTYATGHLAYDSAGRITKITYPDGRTVRQVWNHKGQLLSISEGKLSYFDKARYAQGDDLLTASLGTELTLRKAYDESSRISELAIWKGDQVLFGHRYHYNGYGSVERLDDLAGPKAISFAYDQLNRVSSYQDSSGDARTFSYDSAGNLKSVAASDGNDSIDAKNRLHSSAGLSYDAAGEMTFDGAHTYTYNAEDLITGVDGGKVRYTYNAMGELIERVSRKGIEEYVWLNGQLLAKRETDGTWTDSLYVNGGRIASIHKPLPTKQNPDPKDEVSYFAADRIGLARAAVMADGTVTAAAVFSPFGQPLSDQSLAVAAEAISYSGEIHDPYSGLNVYQFRSYNPRLGRWMSPDPSGLRFADLTNPQTFNLYTFVVNDPMKYFDAHGLSMEDGNEDVPEDEDPDCWEDCVGGGYGGGGSYDPGGGGGGGGPDGACGGLGQVPCVTPINCYTDPLACGLPPDPNPPNPVDPNPPGNGDPGPGDPSPGDPGPGDPGYGDPGYGDPGYGDPGYGDPGYGDPTRGGPGGYYPSPCEYALCFGGGLSDPPPPDRPIVQKGVIARPAYTTDPNVAAYDAEKAALDATDQAGRKYEFGGWIVKDKNGKYTYTIAITFSDPSHFYPDSETVPSGFTKISDYHTHPHNFSTEGEGLSAGDEQRSINTGRTLYEADTFSRALYRYIPGVSTFKKDETCCGAIGDKIATIPK